MQENEGPCFSNYDTVLYHFPHTAIYWSKITYLYSPPVFNALIGISQRITAN